MIYLDHGATSWPKPAGVTAEMARFLTEDAGNPGRGGHRLALAAQAMLDTLRVKLARLFDAEDPDRLIYTLNCTDALNMAIKGTLRQGDHVITTPLEHNSMSRPLQNLAEHGVITLTRVPVGASGVVDPQAVRDALTPATRLIACTHASNVVGTIQPIEAIGQLAREAEVLFLVDAAQTAGVLPISIRRMHIDLLAFPGHKCLLGPPGTGGLYAGPRVDPGPWREGGTGGDSVTPTQPHVYPHWLEAGTPNTVGLAGLGAGVDYVLAQPAGTLLGHIRGLLGRLQDAIREHGSIRLRGPADLDHRVGVASLTVEGLSSEELAGILGGSFEIAVRGGLHCAPDTHRWLGTFPGGTIRVSPGHDNGAEDIDRLVEALNQIAL